MPRIMGSLKVSSLTSCSHKLGFAVQSTEADAEDDEVDVEVLLGSRAGVPSRASSMA